MMNHNRQIFISVLVIFLAGCSSVKKDPLPEVVQVDRVIPYHIVKDGESVGSIASEHSMTRAELIKLNALTPPYQLYNGQRLVINVRVENVSEDSDIVVEETTGQEGEEEHIAGDSLNVMPDSAKEQSSDPQEEDDATVDDVNAASLQVAEENIIKNEYFWPITDGKLKISQSFKDSSDGGIIMQASAGTPVKAIADGIVRIARTLDGDAASYGKTVIILHSAKSKLSVYSHLQEYSVKANQRVKKGEIIGKVGKSGTAKSPQLYLQIFDVNKKDKSRVSMDPEKILP